MDRYEEALERAKQGLPIDEVFPELKESEDERMRNWIISVVMTDKKLTADQKERMKAYLEGQKEQKPADIPSSGSGEMGTTPPAYKLDVKPAEWSEGDERILADIEWLIDNYNWTQEDKAVHKSLLKSLRPQPNWKPSERMMDALEHAVNRTDSIEVQGALYDLQQELNKLV